jgi:hypothetical protein
MNYFFISDDRYFLEGIRYYLDVIWQELSDRSGRILLLHSGSIKRKLRPDYGDVVIVNISDIRTRHRLLNRPVIRLCRVVIMHKACPFRRYIVRGGFPWIMSDNTDMTALIYRLKQAPEESVIRQREVPWRMKRLFYYLGCGYSHEKLADVMKSTPKYIYTMKNSVMKKYGLPGLHAVHILLCRDIVSMKRPRQFIRYSTAGRTTEWCITE